MPTLSLIDSAAGVVNFCSDRSVNFVLAQDQTYLTKRQREYVSAQLGCPVERFVNIRQVHGDRVLTVTRLNLPAFDPPPEADGLVTDLPNIAIAVRTADCLPVSFFDPQKKCVGIVHAGWKSSHLNILAKAVGLMVKNWGCQPRDIQVSFGPAIRACCYQVGPEFKEYFPQAVVSRGPSLYLDLAQVNKTQLLEQGVLAENIQDLGLCTCCQPGFFSYRREGEKAGRHLSLIMLKTGDSRPETRD